MTDPAAKAAARARVAELVGLFKRNEADYLRAAYNETQARTEFITPLLHAFGWDVYNSKGHQLALREVIEEATVEVGEEKSHKKPDYELRLARQRKLFVEAKKPKVPIDIDLAAAFQIRRYGFSASLPISVLTNFRQLAIYDCQTAPNATEPANVARLLIIACEEFEARFDELWPMLSRESVYSGEFDRQFDVAGTRRGAEQFDDLFLKQVRDWRERLAIDIHRNKPGLTSGELTYAVQLFLSRIIFLRICEDREIEKYETLRNLGGGGIFDALMTELRRADAFYDSGLFRLMDDARLGIRISDATLTAIINELYYPTSPYTFAVVEPEVLGEIYELFLGDVIAIEAGHVKIIRKPEVRESGGVIPTPRYIADTITERTLLPLLAGKSPAELQEFRVADICCGSGTFLLAAYEVLCDHYLNWYLDHDRETHIGHRIYKVVANQWRLTFNEKRYILIAHLRGVDIDPNAVEITQFSVLLKLIENETAEALKNHVDRTHTAALPSLDDAIRCGNSLVSLPEWRSACGADRIDDQINPFNWQTEFPREIATGGFDAIIGNPPYIRIQNMAKYSPAEATFYRQAASPYSTAARDNFDKYAIFIERSICLVKPLGRVGMIVPHKFMTIQAGRSLRRLIAADRLLREVVHFGVKQVFGADAANYTCILILERSTADEVRLERPGSLEAWRYGEAGSINLIPAAELGEDPWQFANAETRALFDRISAAHPQQLGTVAEIFVGLQTSANDVYIFQAVAVDGTTCTLRWNDRDWSIEREILHPSLLKVSLVQFARPQPNTWIIFPYELIPNATGRVTAHLIQPADMAARFPGCWTYLNARRQELNERNIQGGRVAERQWYQYGRSQSLTKFDRDKIILPILSVEPRYAYDDRGILVTGGGNGPYYMIRRRPNADFSNHYLLAVLNHPLSEAFVRTNTSPFRGGYYSHGKQFIQTLPIPFPDNAARREIEALVMALIEKRDGLGFDRSPRDRIRLGRESADLAQQIEQRVSQVFGLVPEDQAIIDAVLVPD